MASCFCPQTLVSAGPPTWTYDGVACSNGTATADTRSYSEAKQLNPVVVNPCPCGSASCQHDVSDGLLAVAQPEYVTVYERGVPNPANPDGLPDEPVRNVPVIGEYTADFRLRGEPVRARLVLYAIEKPPPVGPVIRGAAFLIKEGSPPSPIPTPHFSESKNWLNVIATGARVAVEVKGLGRFALQAVENVRSARAEEEPATNGRRRLPLVAALSAS